MILVDTSVWIDYLNGSLSWQTDHLDKALTDETIIIGDLIIAELLQGFDSNADFSIAKEMVNNLNCVQIGGKELAIIAASHFRVLRSKGITIRKTVDMLIGSWCIEHNVNLLHNDKDFERMAEQLPLKMVSPN